MVAEYKILNEVGFGGEFDLVVEIKDLLGLLFGLRLDDNQILLHFSQFKERIRSGLGNEKFV